MSETCEHTGRYNLTACGETATHTVSLDGNKFQDMCLRHASKYVGFGYQVEKIGKPESTCDRVLRLYCLSIGLAPNAMRAHLTGRVAHLGTLVRPGTELKTEKTREWIEIDDQLPLPHGRTRRKVVWCALSEDGLTVDIAHNLIEAIGPE